MSTISLSTNTAATPVSADGLPLWRLYLMRALYLLIALGMGSLIWPEIVSHPLSMHSATSSLLGALTLLCLFGVRYPVQMLPLLMFELTWKSIWLIFVAWPAWRAGQLDGPVWESTQEILWVVIVPFVIPWGYVFRRYLRQPGDRWR